jgi:hypothetical protein
MFQHGFDAINCSMEGSGSIVNYSELIEKKGMVERKDGGEAVVECK